MKTRSSLYPCPLCYSRFVSSRGAQILDGEFGDGVGIFERELVRLNFGAGWRQPNLVRHEWCRSRVGGVKRVGLCGWVSGGWSIGVAATGERGGDVGDRAA